MEPRIQYLQTEDGVSIAYATIGEGKPLVTLPPWAASIEQDWEHPDGRAFMSGLAEGRMLGAASAPLSAKSITSRWSSSFWTCVR